MNKLFPSKSRLVPIALAMTLAGSAHAQFGPIALTTNSYTRDMIVELPKPVTTATVDAGTANSGATLYEIGYNTTSTTTGIPQAGSTFTSSSMSDHSFIMPPSYATNNAILIDAVTTNGTLTFTTPGTYSALSFLVTSGNGAATVNYTVTHQDASVDGGSFPVPDWFNNSPIALTCNGRVNPSGLTFDAVNSGNPRLYSTDIATGSGSPIVSVAFSRNAGGHAVILAVSGFNGGPYTPIVVSGFTQDVVVEAGAQHLPPGTNYTTASMDTGTTNTGTSWYARGFNTAASTTGLPPAGSTIASVSALDHQYKFAPSYSSNNVVYIDPTHSGTLTWVTPTNHSALSFLASAGHGPTKVDYVVNHADTSTENGVFAVPDWFFNVTNVAFICKGRVTLASGLYTDVNGTNPRIYNLDITLSNTVSPVTSVNVSWDAGNTNTAGLAAIFAVSGTGGNFPPVIGTQPASTNAPAGTNFVFSTSISGTAPLTLHWQKQTNGVFVNLTNSSHFSGVTTTNLTIINPTLADYGFYQLVATNSVGSVTSSVARLNVVTTAPDVTAAGDSISISTGSSPVGEGVGNAIDNSMTKYLNYGGSQFPPFQGPVGLVVTPTSGGSVVTGLRIYTANDFPERDPADYLLEGSNDGGGSFAPIASGPLSLPDDRNTAGLAVNPISDFNQEVGFANSVNYTTYRLSFTNVKTNAIANSAAVGEIELLAGPVVVPTVTLNVTKVGSLLQLSWSQGTLQEATSVTGPWSSNFGATSPYNVAPSDPQHYFRVLVQ
ncbi:MAG: Immunoglobulin I-set domain protein [Pedosphaera sp.]|nr:Immunoglobulin I-set domain protein [Pedosphaera sp.]